MSSGNGTDFDIGKEIHDSVWGTVRIRQDEIQVLDHPLIQRLRRISQLGLVNMVYPGAGHSRLSHSIGVLALASRVGKRLRVMKEIEEGEEQLLRLAAIVHDVGHYPLSHSTEEVYKTKDIDGPNHLNLGVQIIRNTSLGDKLDSILGQYGMDRNDVADTIKGKTTESVDKPAIWQLINSNFDLDRMDYLMRDGASVGLDYGRIDFDRILSNIVIDSERKSLGIDVKAQTAVENYVLARYYLWDTVYLHKAVMGFELVQQEACRSLLQLDDSMPKGEEIADMIDDETKFCEFDDNYFWMALFRGMKVDTRINQLGEMLRDRHPLRLAYEAPPPSDPVLIPPNDAISNANPYLENTDLIETMLDKINLPPEWYFPIKNTLAIHEFLPLLEDEPYDPKYAEMKEEAIETRAKTIRMFHIDKEGEKSFAGYLAMHPSSVVSILSKFSKIRIRFYTTEKYEDVLCNYLKDNIEN